MLLAILYPLIANVCVQLIEDGTPEGFTAQRCG